MSAVRIFAVLAALAGLSACGAAPAASFKPTAPFDPARDRDHVVDCISAHLSLGPIGYEVLRKPEAELRTELQGEEVRFNRLKPYATAVERREGMQEGDLYGEAGRKSAPLHRRLALEALVPGSHGRIWKEALARSAACDAAVDAWEKMKPAGADPAARAGGEAPRWYGDAESARYGVAGAAPQLWVGCDQGRLAIGGFAGEGGETGRPTTVVLAGRAHPAVLGEGGDGEVTYRAEIAGDDPALGALLAGRTLQVAQGDRRWEVPGAGADKVLNSVIAACAKARG